MMVRNLEFLVTKARKLAKNVQIRLMILRWLELFHRYKIMFNINKY